MSTFIVTDLLHFDPTVCVILICAISVYCTISVSVRLFWGIPVFRKRATSLCTVVCFSNLTYIVMIGNHQNTFDNSQLFKFKFKIEIHLPRPVSESIFF